MDIEETQCLEWLASGDCGISSKTMLYAITGIPTDRHDHPHDISDVGRCVRMLRKLPFLRPKIEAVTEKFPHWMPFIDCWQHLERLYDECIEFERLPLGEMAKMKRRKHFKSPNSKAWSLMQELVCASRYLNGLRMQNSPNSWSNKAPSKY
jgi:hypothetical protein